LQAIRDVAKEKERAKKVIARELRDVQNYQQEHLDEVQEAKVRHEGIQQGLRRLTPGKSTSLSVIQDLRRRMLTDPTEMARTLREHWSKVFGKMCTDRNITERWLQEEQEGQDNLHSGDDKS
jgi:hypothetical protein